MRRIPITKAQSQTPPSETPEETLESTEAQLPEEEAAGTAQAAPGDADSSLAGETSVESQSLPDEQGTEILRLETELKETRDQLIRSLADMENVRKRAQKDREDAAQFGAQNLLSDLLPVIDNLERAVSVSDKATVDSLLEGVNLTLRHFQETLKKHGVEPIEGTGQPFDAQVHEAIMRADPTEDHPAGTVVDEIRKGYTLRGRLLRPSLVKVAQEE